MNSIEIHFILVEAALPENIGAAARAIKTMGFRSLMLVDSADHLCDRARWVAHGSNDVLENAVVYQKFEDAAKEIDFLIGTTVRKRAFKRHYYGADELVGLIKKKFDSINSVGVVFGPEKSGLDSETLKKCDVVSTIPMKYDFPSLNLAQAVMVYAYELSDLILNNGSSEILNPTESDFRVLKKKVSQLLEIFGISSDLNVYHRLMERFGFMNSEDISLVHFVCERIYKFLKEVNHGKTSKIS